MNNDFIDVESKLSSSNYDFLDNSLLATEAQIEAQKESLMQALQQGSVSEINAGSVKNISLPNISANNIFVPDNYDFNQTGQLSGRYTPVDYGTPTQGQNNPYFPANVPMLGQTNPYALVDSYSTPMSGQMNPYRSTDSYNVPMPPYAPPYNIPMARQTNPYRSTDNYSIPMPGQINLPYASAYNPGQGNPYYGQLSMPPVQPIIIIENPNASQSKQDNNLLPTALASLLNSRLAIQSGRGGHFLSIGAGFPYPYPYINLNQGYLHNNFPYLSQYNPYNQYNLNLVPYGNVIPYINTVPLPPNWNRYRVNPRNYNYPIIYSPYY